MAGLTKLLRHLSFVLGVILLAAISASAQLSTGTILGVVKDSSGASVAGATVTVTNVDTNFTRTGPTESDGSFRYPAMPVGNYEIRVTANGFQTLDRKGVTLEVSQEISLDLSLQVGSSAQTVTVTEEAPLVDTTTSSVGGEVTEQKVADLPLNGRNWVNLALLQPGVTQSQLVPNGVLGPIGASGTMFSSSGATLWSNMFTIDGANMMNGTGINTSSVIGSALGVDGIKEYKVVTNMFSAEYGLTMGSQTVIASKGGTNQFHGDAFEYVRNSALDARNYFDPTDTANANGFGANKSLPYPGKRIPPFQRNNFGGSFGGPVQRDKTFLFGTYEGLRQRLGQTIATTTIPKACFVPAGSTTAAAVIPATINNGTTGATLNPFGTCAGAAATISITNPSIQLLADLFPQPNVVGYPTLNYTFPFIQPASENYEQVRVDHNFSDKDSAFARYTQDISDETQSGSYKPFVIALHSASQFATLGETHVFSPSLLNTARFSFSRTVLNEFSPPTGITTVTLVAGKDFGNLTPGSGVTGFQLPFQPAQVWQNIYQWSDDVFLTKGRHGLKFGTLIQHISPTEELLSVTSRGIAAFSSLTNFFAGNYSSISRLGPGSSEDRRQTSNTLGFYAQDDFRVTSRLTLNLGLRWEFSTIPTEPASQSYNIRNPLTDTNGTAGPIFGTNNSLPSVSPRIGLAWDVFGKGTTSVRAGWGIYYDIGNLGNSFVSTTSAGIPVSFLQATTNATAPCTGANTNPCFTAPLTLANNVLPSPGWIDYNLQQPRMFQYNVTVAQRLPWNMALTVGYVGSKGNNLIEQIEGNPTVPLGFFSNGLPYYCVPLGGGVPSATNPCDKGASFPITRQNPAFGQAKFITAGANSWYNALQIALNKQVTKGLQFQFAYTWSKLIDQGETQSGSINSEITQCTTYPITPLKASCDQGLAAFDVASNARVNVLYHLPNLRSSGVVSQFTNGWWFGTILAAQSGFPLTAVLSSDRALQNNTAQQSQDRPNLDVSYNASAVVTHNPAGWLNLSMFDIPPAGTLGNEPRDNIMAGPGLLNLDLSVNKDFKLRMLGEQGALQFRMETFNILNHPNFNVPNVTVWSAPSAGISSTPAGGQLQAFGATSGAPFTATSTAGQITSTATYSRQIQFALKVIF